MKLNTVAAITLALIVSFLSVPAVHGFGRGRNLTESVGVDYDAEEGGGEQGINSRQLFFDEQTEANDNGGEGGTQAHRRSGLRQLKGSSSSSKSSKSYSKSSKGKSKSSKGM